MTRSWCVPLMIAVMTAGCSAPVTRAALTPMPRASQQTLRVQIAEQQNAVRTVNLEDYVRGTILSEFAPPDGDPALVERMLGLQAVIARTYALANRGRHGRQGFDLCSTSHCQLYEPSRLKTSRWAPLAMTAARRTAGAVLLYERAPAAALFHSDCGGHTSTSVAAWGGTPRPYLRSARDDGPAAKAHGEWRYAASLAVLRQALNADPRTRVGARLDDIRVTARDASGRAAAVKILGTHPRVVRGEDLRAVVSRRFGARAVRSTMFTIRRDGGALVFEGRGFGHGVGLCQVGALARLRAGEAPGDVLSRYYPGTTLTARP